MSGHLGVITHSFSQSGHVRNPVGDRLQHGRGNCFFDRLVFAQTTGRAGLKQMVQCGKFDRFEACVAASFQSGLDGRKIQAWINLHVFFAIECPHRTFDSLQH